MARRVKFDNYAVAAVPRLGLVGWLRWMWRQVTSMRVALILLLLLGVASIPGSVLPQWPQNPAKVRGYLAANPDVGPVLDRLGFLDVFNSPWFTSIYVLLLASLVGCIVPRTFAYAKAYRDTPGAAPSSLARYDVKASAKVPDARVALERAAASLRGGLTPYRVRIDERPRKGGGHELALTADQGHVRELGNLAFHLGIVCVIVVGALSSFLTYRGQAIVVEGRSFTNSVVAYDSFEPGRAFNADRLSPFVVTLEDLRTEFDLSGRPLDFEATVGVVSADGNERRDTIKVNSPLVVDGVKLYLQGNGYAPVVTVTDADGNVAFSGAVPFLPQDSAYTSVGVIKVPDVTSGDQIGLRATLLPTALIDGDTAVSLHPEAANPVIVFQAYRGNLGLDDGVPQNVYVLDESRLSPVRNAEGDHAVFVMVPGQTIELPDGLGTVTWDDLPRFAALDVRADPTLPWLLASALLALSGLTLSLFGARRKVWMIAPARGAATVVGAAYAPFHDDNLAAVLDAAMAAAKEDT